MYENKTQSGFLMLSHGFVGSYSISVHDNIQELDLLDTNRQRGRQTRSKYHTYKVNRSGPVNANPGLKVN